MSTVSNDALELRSASERAAPAEARLRAASAATIAAMVLAVLALYCPLSLFDGKHTLLGLDYSLLHERRLDYAQEALFGEHPRLPAWNSRELLGTPFWSNVQSFPFLPTRLALLWIDPSVLYAVAVNVAAILTAVFTYLYGRRIGMGRVAAAVAGWTFAASGFFASRVLGGHLPLIEAFAALPLLLWCVERVVAATADGARPWPRLLALSVAVLCTVLAGHPQIPAYAVLTAILYAIVRARGWLRMRALASMALGVGMSAFAWAPALALIGRSTRLLALERDATDISFPMWRLKAFFVPWADGWPAPIERSGVHPFENPATFYFWDTVCYVGWLPWLAVVVIAGAWISRRGSSARSWRGPWRFLAMMGVVALLVSLDFQKIGDPEARMTLLRSPARLVYLTIFTLAVATGVLVDRVLSWGVGARRLPALALASVLLAAHGVDVWAHGRSFVRVADASPNMSREQVEAWRAHVADQRLCIDRILAHGLGGRVDDVGFNDSIMLARPYRAVLAMADARRLENTEFFDAVRLPAPALAGLAAALLSTRSQRPDLELLSENGGTYAYAIPGPSRRAHFVPDARVAFAEEEQVLDRYRDQSLDLREKMTLAPAQRPADFDPDPAAASDVQSVAYERPDSDHIRVRASVPVPGYLRILESWDDGWSATADGAPVQIEVADTFAMAVRLAPGDHEVRLVYRTPGALAGLAITAMSVVLLAVLAWTTALGARPRSA